MTEIAAFSVSAVLQTQLAGLKPDEPRLLFHVEAPHRPAAGNKSTERFLAALSELQECRSRSRTGIPGHFPYNARLFGYGFGAFLAFAGLLVALYAADGGDLLSPP